jgi:hypothetical protein
LAILASGCATVTVSHDYDLEADFSRFGTFAWAPVTEPEAKADVPGAPGSLLDKRIRQNVNQQMRANGLREDTQNPDLLVAYSIGIQEREVVTEEGSVHRGPHAAPYPYRRHPAGRYPYGRYPYYEPRGSWTRDIQVQTYQEGTLIVDLVDAKGEAIVWRGVAQGTVQENISAEQRAKNVADAVAKIFEKYPPGK